MANNCWGYWILFFLRGLDHDILIYEASQHGWGRLMSAEQFKAEWKEFCILLRTVNIKVVDMTWVFSEWPDVRAKPDFFFFFFFFSQISRQPSV